MSHGYVPVQWNRNKKIYDAVLWVGILVYLGLFIGITLSLHGSDEKISMMTLMIRALGSLAFLLLTLILMIGPLSRLNKKFLPLLYNRRHLGVSTFIIALAHGVLVLLWYHGFGVVDPITSVFTSPGDFSSSANVPFQPFGFIALVFLFILAATSHDYWNTNLTAPIWKAIHMGVYLAYGLVIAHVTFGAMQDEQVGWMPWLVVLSVALVGLLHLAAAFLKSNADYTLEQADWVAIEDWRKIPNNQAMVVAVGSKERVAIFRYDQTKFAAVSNVCKHQNGPLGEGCMKDGLITCPWHGFQYKPEDGCAPEPFNEKIATYDLKFENHMLYLNPAPLPEGTARDVLHLQVQTDDKA